MGNFLLASKIVAPLFLLMAVGFAMRSFKVIDRKVADGMNDAVFKVFLPALLFRNIYDTTIGDAFDGRLVIFSYCAIAAIAALAAVFVMAVEKDNTKRGVLVQAIFRSNFVIFGLPLTESILGEGHAGSTALLIAFVVPVFNAISVGFFEYFRGGSFRPVSMLKNILKNPLIIVSALGLTFLLLGLRLPGVIESAVSSIADVATPLALIALGATIEFKSVPGNARQLTIGVLGRLVAVPLLGIPAGVLMGFRGAPLVALVAMFSTPTAVSSFTMAKNMDADAELAAQLVVFTSAFSIISVFAVVYLMISLGYI